MRSEKRILKSLGTNNFEMRGFFCGSLNPCTCQAAPALNVWLVQHLMLRRNYLHSSIQSRHLLHNLCHNGLHLSAARSMKAQATSKRQLWQQNQKHQTSSRLLTVELIMCIVRMWITPSSNLYDIHIYTFRLSGSASSFHTPKVTSPHNIQRIWVLQSSQVAGILSQNMWTERAATKRNDGLPWPPLSDPATHPFPNQVTPWQSSDKLGSPPRACVANPRCFKGLIGPASNCSRTFRKLNCWRSVPFKETHRLHGCVAHQRNWSAHPDK